MRLVHPSRWWLTPAITLPGAVAAALLSEVLPKPLGVVLCVNLLLPATVAVASVAYPRWWSPAIAGAVALLGFTLTRAAWADHAFWQWKPTWIVGQVLHPIALIACAVATLAGSLVVSSLRPWLRVGVDRPSGACRHCGYHAGRNKICPECGKPNPHSTV
jgi:hypothetical protein